MFSQANKEFASSGLCCGEHSQAVASKAQQNLSYVPQYPIT